ncbi:hypothetical protein [Micromonospora rubida]
MGHTIAVSRKPLDDAPGAGRARPGQPAKLNCRYLRRGAAGQCTAEAVDPDADVILCARHTALVVEFYAAAVAQLGADQ